MKKITIHLLLCLLSSNMLTGFAQNAQKDVFYYNFDKKIYPKSDYIVVESNVAKRQPIAFDPRPSQAISNLGMSLTCYPKPSQGPLNIELASQETAPLVLRVRDILGRSLYTSRLNAQKGNNQYQVDLSSLPSGQYLLEVIQGHSKLSQKLKLTNYTPRAGSNWSRPLFF